MNTTDALHHLDRFQHQKTRNEGLIVLFGILLILFLIGFVISGPPWAFWLAMSIVSLGLMIFYIANNFLDTLDFYEVRYFRQTVKKMDYEDMLQEMKNQDAMNDK
jgi:hypothetical protein